MTIGIPELIIIAAILAVVFGIPKLPKIGRSLGILKREVDETKKEFESIAGPFFREEIDEKLLLFLSSIMDPRVDDLLKEREAIKSILTHEKLFNLWRFEDAPADDEMEESYLSKVENCHIFIVIIGETVSKAVQKEFDTAIENGKPILAFFKSGIETDEKVEAFKRSARKRNLRYKSFQTIPELQKEVVKATYHCVIKYFKNSLTSKTYFSFLMLLSLLDGDESIVEIIDYFDDKPLFGSIELPETNVKVTAESGANNIDSKGDEVYSIKIHRMLKSMEKQVRRNLKKLRDI